MIRITQTYINNAAKDYFEKNGWNILYFDLPGGRRSGVGNHGLVNSLWEKLYNLSPDLVIEKDNLVILFEVDAKLNAEYIEKFSKYKSGESELLRGLNSIFELNLERLEFGFISIKNYATVDINCKFYPFHYLYYDDKICKLQEKTFTSFEK